MPSTAFLTALSALGGEGATLLKGEISAVSTGLLEVEVNGGTFERVPVLDNTGWTPAVGAQVYLLYQENFGMLAIGSPRTPTPSTPFPASVSETIAPDARGNYSSNTDSWTAATGPIIQLAPYAAVGGWFYTTADFAAWTTRDLAGVEMELLITSGTPQLTLLRNEPLDGTPDTYSGPLTVSEPLGAPVWVPLPLSWGTDLINGTALGIAARSQSFDAVLDLHGNIRLTSL